MSTKSKQDKLRSIAEYKAKKEANEIEKQKELMLQFPTLFSPEKIKKIEQRKHERLPISIKNEVKNIKQENLNKNQFKKGNNNNSNNSPNKINLLEKKKQFQLLTNPKNGKIISFLIICITVIITLSSFLTFIHSFLK